MLEYFRKTRSHSLKCSSALEPAIAFCVCSLDSFTLYTKGLLENSFMINLTLAVENVNLKYNKYFHTAPILVQFLVALQHLLQNIHHLHQEQSVKD